MDSLRAGDRVRPMPGVDLPTPPGGEALAAVLIAAALRAELAHSEPPPGHERIYEHLEHLAYLILRLAEAAP